MEEIEFIIFVKDQEQSKSFYQKLLEIEPTLHVQGITEFTLGKHCKLGLMPEKGIAQIIDNQLPHPETGNGIPRSELYLKVHNAEKYIKRGINLGALLISPFQDRNWGDKVGYIADQDGHIIAFAEK